VVRGGLATTNARLPQALIETGLTNLNAPLRGSRLAILELAHEAADLGKRYFPAAVGV